MPGDKRQPIVNSVASQLKRTVKPISDTNPATPEQTKQRKQKLLGILDKSADEFLNALSKGEAELKTSADLERIVKLTLLLSGEADTIQGSSAMEETINDTKLMAELNMSKVEDILNPDDPAVKEIYNKLFEGYNNINDIEEN